MADLNRVSLTGKVGGLPVLRKLVSGTLVCYFRFAVRRRAPKREEKLGHLSARVDWLDVVCWNKVAQVVAAYSSKGSPLALAGKLRTREWTGDDGVKRQRVEVFAEEVFFLETPQAAKRRREELLAKVREAKRRGEEVAEDE